MELLPCGFFKPNLLFALVGAEELSVWVVVFVVPINAAVDPIMYTFTTPKFRLILAQLFQGATCRTAEPHQHQPQQRKDEPMTLTSTTLPLVRKLFFHT